MDVTAQIGRGETDEELPVDPVDVKAHAAAVYHRVGHKFSLQQHLRQQLLRLAALFRGRQRREYGKHQDN